jgi:hypothetical protein
VPCGWPYGGVALVSHSGPVEPSPRETSILPGFGERAGTHRGGTMRFWFRDWQVSGGMVEAREERAFGPILFALHTLNRRALKLTAQMAPVDEPGKEVALQVDRTGWKTIARSSIDPLSRTATFRIPEWDDTRDVPYRISYVSDAASTSIPARFARTPKTSRKSSSPLSPAIMLLPKARIVNGWAQNPEYDAARDGDVPGAELLGKRQMDFLDAWAGDWSGGAWRKAVVWQTLFANLATLPRSSRGDEVTPKLRVMRPDEYCEDEAPVADHDSNGWPQTPRNQALRAMRRARAVHISGDQHLGSTIQYGIENWNDASWAICVPCRIPSCPGRRRPRFTTAPRDAARNPANALPVASRAQNRLN